MHRNAVAEMPWVLENTGSFILKKIENAVYARVTLELLQLKSSKWTWYLLQFLIPYWKTFRNLSSLSRNLTYLSLLNSVLLLSRFSVSLKSHGNYFFRWVAYESLFSRFSVLISYNMWSSNHFPYPAVSHVFQGPGFPGSRFFRVHIFQGPGPGSGSRF